MIIRHSRFHAIDSSLLYGLAVLSILILSNVSKSIVLLQKTNTTPNKEVTVISTPQEATFIDVKIKGKAYVVYDIVNKKILGGKNIDTRLPLASISKVMTAITARTHNDSEKIITIHPESMDDGYDLGLKKNQTWKLDELLKYTLVFSSNDGAQAIADGLGGRALFVSQMNEDATKLGLDLFFTHPAGLDIDNQIGGTGSALSVAKLVAIARKELPEVFDATTKRRVSVTSSTGRVTGIPNTNQDVVNFPGIEMSKTGFTDKAGGNLVVVVDTSIGHPIAIVVLGSTHESRFSDMKTIYKALEQSSIK
jgi:D-alanyl-D-alanine carboxypeptidase